MEARAEGEESASPVSTVRFGPFRLDIRAGELLKDGRRIRLQEQPFQILRMLLEEPGEVVSREEIRQRLWPDDTVVEFDHSINAAVKRLRDALRDSADRPRYIETLARRGYRFVGQLDTADRHSRAEPLVVTPGSDVPIQPAEPSAGRPPLQPQRRQIRSSLLLATVILLTLVGVWYYRHSPRPKEPLLQPLVRLDVDLGNDVSPGSYGGATAILSPDGTRLVYVSRSRLFTRRLDQAKVTELAGTEGAHTPFFSTDGQWVAFFAQGKLKKVPVWGGPPTTLCDVPLGRGGASWGEDENIVAALDRVLSRVPSGGGAPTHVTELAPGDVEHRWPQVLPGAKAVLFSAYSSVTGLDGANIEALSFKDGRRKTVVRGGTWGRYLPSGHLVYINKGTLVAVPFDVERLDVRGTPTAVLEEVAYSTAWGSAQVDFSQVGRLVYRSSKAGSGLVTVQWLEGSGHTRPLLPVPGNYLSPTLSPDGTRLALTSSGDIWVYELGRASMTRLTFGGGYSNPLWTADGRYIVFRAARGMFWTRADRTALPQVLTQSNNEQTPWSFTADGKRLAFVEINPATGADIWTVPVEIGSSGLRAGKPEVFLQTPFHNRSPMISPDGRWLAYQSDESGRYRIYVQAFTDKHGKRQISPDGGTYPAWSRNGDELFFWQNGANQLMVVSYKRRGESFMADTPRVWSEQKLVSFGTTRSYDPAPDGKRIVALMPSEELVGQNASDHVIFLLNFFDELRRRVPTERK